MKKIVRVKAVAVNYRIRKRNKNVDDSVVQQNNAYRKENLHIQIQDRTQQ